MQRTITAMVSFVLNNIPFDKSDLDDDARNIALGRFMTAWGQVEVMWGFVFKSLLTLRDDVSMVVFDVVDTNRQLQVMKAVAEMLPRPEQREMLLTLFDDVKLLSETRNKIIHANWGIVDGQVARVYRAISRAQWDAIGVDDAKGKSIRTRLIFTVVDLNAATDRAVALRDRLQIAIDASLPDTSRRGIFNAEVEMAFEDFERRRKRFLEDGTPMGPPGLYD